MSDKKAVSTAEAPKAIGPYSQAIITGNFVFCSGQVPFDPATMQLEPSEIVPQTRRVLANIAAVLKAAGSHPSKIVKTTVFLTNFDDFDAFNKEYEAFFRSVAEGVPTPARSTVQVSRLPRNSLVEIEAIALLG